MKGRSLIGINVLLVLAIVLIFIIGSNMFQPKKDSNQAIKEPKKELKQEAFTSPYLDIPNDDKRLDTIMWATEKGLVKPDKQGNFNPKMNVTEAQLATIIVAYYETLHKEVDTLKGINETEKQEKIYTALLQYQVPLKGYIDVKQRENKINVGDTAFVLSYLEGEDYASPTEAFAYLQKVKISVWKDKNATDYVQKYDLIATFKALEKQKVTDLAERVKNQKTTPEKALLALQQVEVEETEIKEEEDNVEEQEMESDEVTQNNNYEIKKGDTNSYQRESTTRNNSWKEPAPVITETPKTEEPKIETPKTEEPKIETSKTEEPITETPKTEEPTEPAPGPEQKEIESLLPEPSGGEN